MMHALGLSRIHSRVWRILRTATVLCAGSLALFAGGCQKPTTSEQQTRSSKESASAKQTTYNDTDPRWVEQHPTHATTALVFIHGIFGDTLDTWTEKGNPSFFKFIFEDPTVGKYVDVYAFGFTSKMFGSGSFNIQQAADKLEGYIDHDLRQQGYKQFVFVGHSMGGLVVLKYLLTYRGMLERVPLVFFYAVPQAGAQIADIANHVAQNPALADMVPADKNGFLQSLSSEWKAIEGARPHVSCAYETKETDGVLIVGWTSANYFCEGPAAPIEADHIHIVKPTRPNDNAVFVLVNALNKWAVGPQFSGQLYTPDFKVVHGHSVVEMIKSQHTSTLENRGFRHLTYGIDSITNADYLWISPKDQPIIRPNEKRRYVIKGEGGMTWLTFLLLEGAPHTDDYSFVLSSDDAGDRTVLVKIPDWSVITQHRIERARRAASNLMTALDYEVAARAGAMRDARCAAERSDTSRRVSTDTVIAAVRRAIGEDDPTLPSTAIWVATADFLNSVNWSTLAVVALQQLERSSHVDTQTPSLRALSASVAARSGKERIFAGRDGSASTPQRDAMLAVQHQLLVRPELADLSALLAQRMQAVPSLRPYGLSLQGDLLWEQGKFAEAQLAYRAAAQILQTPSLTYRLQTVIDLTPPPPPATVAPPPPSTLCATASNVRVGTGSDDGSHWPFDPDKVNLKDLRLLHVNTQGPNASALVPLGKVALVGEGAKLLSTRHDGCSNTTLDRGCIVDLQCLSPGKAIEDIRAVVSPGPDCDATPVVTDIHGVCGEATPNPPSGVTVR